MDKPTLADYAHLISTFSANFNNQRHCANNTPYLSSIPDYLDLKLHVV